MAIEISGTKEKRDLVDRVANSPTFQKSPRLREFLLYVSACTIDERLEDAREQQIATNVFNRKPDYNPGQDNIVRVEARSLRKRLEAYFATEGKNEPVIISMPKGGYAICFEARPPEFEASVPIDISYPAEAVVAIPQKRSPRLMNVFWVIVLGLAGSVMWQLKRPEKAAVRPAPAPAPTLSLPFSALFEATRDTYIVTSDSSLVLIQDLRRRQITLDDYITGRYMGEKSATASDPAREELVQVLMKRRYTNGAETAIAGRIIQRNSWACQRVFLRSGHSVQLSDFKNHNVILFGSPTSNPWDRLFSEKLNFQFEWDSVRRGMFRNRSPRAGEQSVYSMTTNSGDSGRAYADVAFVPNVNGEGHVLMIVGTTAEGTEAAGEFITDEARTETALKSIGIDPAGPPRYFEILLEAKAVAGSASQSTILASRLIPDTK